MRMMAFYGKGGVGKSTVVTNLSVLFARQNKRVLQFGCDPKSDSCYNLVGGRIITVMDEWLRRGEADLRLDHFLMKGAGGVDCIEVGGPAPGSGCGGRGITKAFELVGEPETLGRSYDVVLFDVLGDVVCGGFSAPMRSGYAREVYIVTSEELRSLYAANNISQAVNACARDGVRLCGLVGNLKSGPEGAVMIEKLADAMDSRLLLSIPRDQTVQRAELGRMPCVEFDAACPASLAFSELYQKIVHLKPETMPAVRPLARAEFDELFMSAAENGSTRPPDRPPGP